MTNQPCDRQALEQLDQQNSGLQSADADLDQRMQEFGATLLGPDSPLSSESAFKRDREQNVALLQERDSLQKQLTVLCSVVEAVGKAEKEFKNSETQLQNQRKLLLDFAVKLGETAFASLQSGETADATYFAARKKLQEKIDALNRQKSALLQAGGKGLLDQAAVKAQELTLTGQVKLEEMKISAANHALGKQIISEAAEESLRCSTTEKILDAIVNQRAKILDAQKVFEQAEAFYNATRDNAANQIGANSVADKASLESQFSQQQRQVRSIDLQLAELQISVADKALGYEWLQDNPEIRDQLRQLTLLKHAETPRKLSVWPLAVPVVAGHLLVNFGQQPLNLSPQGILLLYVVAGLGGFMLLAYYKPEVTDDSRLGKVLGLLFGYSLISVIGLTLFMELAGYAVKHWSQRPSFFQHPRLFIFDLPRTLIVSVGQAYQETLAIMGGIRQPDSFVTYFRDHLLSVGMCEELVKLAPALIAFAGFSGDWRSRGESFNSKLVYLAMIGGLAFGLGEAVHYHFTMYLPNQFGWGAYALRFLSVVTIHAVWAGISGWILAHVTGTWIREAFSVSTAGWGLGFGVGCLLVMLSVGLSDVLHTSHNLSNNQLWMLAWDVLSLVVFAWLIRCSKVSQLIPRQMTRQLKRVAAGS